MAERTFLIQRYCADMHPQVRGQRPFLVTGPGFEQWIVPGSLERKGEYVMRPQVRRTLTEAFPPGGEHQRQYQHEAAAEVLLREGVVMALWSIDSPDCLPPELRWDEAVRQLRRELPFGTAGGPADRGTVDGFWEIADSVAELLSGMPSPAMAREYVSEDRLTLEAMAVPEP